MFVLVITAICVCSCEQNEVIMNHLNINYSYKELDINKCKEFSDQYGYEYSTGNIGGCKAHFIVDRENKYIVYVYTWDNDDAHDYADWTYEYDVVGHVLSYDNICIVVKMSNALIVSSTNIGNDFMNYIGISVPKTRFKKGFVEKNSPVDIDIEKAADLLKKQGFSAFQYYEEWSEKIYNYDIYMFTDSSGTHSMWITKDFDDFIDSAKEKDVGYVIHCNNCILGAYDNTWEKIIPEITK